AGTLDGFGTIAHQRLRPNERPKIPIAGGNKYLKIRPKQGSRLKRRNQKLTVEEPCAATVNHESAEHIDPPAPFQMRLRNREQVLEGVARLRLGNTRPRPDPHLVVMKCGATVGRDWICAR